MVQQNSEFEPCFELMLKYPDRLTFDLCAALAAALKWPQLDVLEDLGTYLVSHKNGQNLRRLLRFGGQKYEEFLISLDELNDRSELPFLALLCRRCASSAIAWRCFILSWARAGRGLKR